MGAIRLRGAAQKISVLGCSIHYELQIPNFELLECAKFRKNQMLVSYFI